MAGGPLPPVSALPLTNTFTYNMVYVGQGSVNDHTEMMGVVDATTLTSDAIWHLVWLMPTELPSGTGKLLLDTRANGTGTMNVNPKWKTVAEGNDPSTGSLNAEGTTGVVLSSGDEDDIVTTKITLDADTIVSGQYIHMDLTFEDTSTTLNADSGHLAYIIWE